MPRGAVPRQRCPVGNVPHPLYCRGRRRHCSPPLPRACTHFHHRPYDYCMSSCPSSGNPVCELNEPRHRARSHPHGCVHSSRSHSCDHPHTRTYSGNNRVQTERQYPHEYGDHCHHHHHHRHDQYHQQPPPPPPPLQQRAQPAQSTHLPLSRSLTRVLAEIEAQYVGGGDPVPLYRALLIASVGREERMRRQCARLAAEVARRTRKEETDVAYVAALESVVTRLVSQRRERGLSRCDPQSGREGRHHPQPRQPQQEQRLMTGQERKSAPRGGLPPARETSWSEADVFHVDLVAADMHETTPFSVLPVATSAAGSFGMEGCLPSLKDTQCRKVKSAPPPALQASRQANTAAGTLAEAAAAVPTVSIQGMTSSLTLSPRQRPQRPQQSPPAATTPRAAALEKAAEHEQAVGDLLALIRRRAEKDRATTARLLAAQRAPTAREAAASSPCGPQLAEVLPVAESAPDVGDAAVVAADLGNAEEDAEISIDSAQHAQPSATDAATEKDNTLRDSAQTSARPLTVADLFGGYLTGARAERVSVESARLASFSNDFLNGNRVSHDEGSASESFDEVELDDVSQGARGEALAEDGGGYAEGEGWEEEDNADTEEDDDQSSAVDEDAEFSREFDEWRNRLEELLDGEKTP